MPKVVASGAQLKCSQGDSSSTLISTTAPKVTIEGKTLATTMDFMPSTNIPPFGICKITQKPCLPVLPLPWSSPIVGLSAASVPLLPYDSTIQCAVGGKIFVADCNQASMIINEGKPPEKPHAEPGPSPEERRQMDKEEALLRHYLPEYADQLYGPEESPEQLEALINELRKEEEAAEKIITIIRDAVSNKQKAEERAKIAREARETIEIAKRRRIELQERLVQIRNRQMRIRINNRIPKR